MNAPRRILVVFYSRSEIRSDAAFGKLFRFALSIKDWLAAREPHMCAE